MAHLCCAVLDLAGHAHGPGCGHSAFEHEGHVDYLVGDELHHVSDSCCVKNCHHGPVVVSHGRLSMLLHRRRGAADSNEPMAAPLLHSRPAAAAGAASLEVEAAAGSAEPQPRTTRIYASGICCPMEVPLVHSVLDELPGVEQVDVVVVSQLVTVRHDAAQCSPAALVAALNGVMLDASLTAPRQQASVRGRWVPPWHVLLGAVLLIVSLFHYLSGPTGADWLENFNYIALGSVALCLPLIALRAALALRRGYLDIHLLVTLATAGAIALADYGEAAAVVVLFAVAEHWERCSTDKARDAVTAVLTLRPESAKLAASGLLVPVEEVETGTEIIVAPGEAVPLDGEVLSGESAIDESLLTGESAPVLRGPGTMVRAGTLNCGSGVLRVRTTAAAGDTAVARMAALVEQAASQQSPAEALVARFARIYTPVILAACILLAFLPWSWSDDRKHWVYLSLQVLVTACPCALVLSTPATVVCALARAAQAGVLFKGGAALESMSRVGVVTFDKTGTLTKGQFQVVDCQTTNGWSRSELLRLLGSLEAGSSHPLAAAVIGYAAAQGVRCDAAVESAHSVPGAGMVATVDGRHVAAGNAALLATQGLTGPEVTAAQRPIDAEGGTACFVAVDGQLAGWLSARDVVRPEAAEAVALLSKLGCSAAMLTGDAAAAAQAVGAAVGLPPDHVHAQLLPEQKLNKVQEYKVGPPTSSPCPGSHCAAVLPVAGCCLGRGGGRRVKHKRMWVAHVGDGANDTPALAASDAGVAMGVAGSAAALEAGSVALFTSDVRAVPAALMLARAAGRTIMLNIIFSVATKVAVLVPALMGKFTLWGAVAVDVGAALLVMANSLRLLKWRWPVENARESAAHRANTKPCCADGACSAGKPAAKPPCCAGGACSAGKPAAKPSCCAGSACGDKSEHSHSHTHAEDTHGDCCCGSKPAAKPTCCSGGGCGSKHEHSHSHSHSHGKHSQAGRGSCSGQAAANPSCCSSSGCDEERDEHKHSHSRSGCGHQDHKHGGKGRNPSHPSHAEHAHGGGGCSGKHEHEHGHSHSHLHSHSHSHSHSRSHSHLHSRSHSDSDE